MDFKAFKNQRGWGMGDVIFWVVVIAVLAWVAKQYLLNPEGLNSRPVNHSPLEDSR